MSDQFRPMALIINGKTSVAVETLPDGSPCLIMPAEIDVDGEQCVFLPKVRIVSNLQVPNSDGYLTPVQSAGE